MKRRHLAACQIVTNWRAVEALSADRRVWSLYRIDCLAPGFYYIGISSQIPVRAYSHLSGTMTKSEAQMFTGQHGVRTMTVLAVFKSREDAEVAEWRLYWKCRERDGDRVGGFSPGALQWGLGGA